MNSQVISARYVFILPKSVIFLTMLSGASVESGTKTLMAIGVQTNGHRALLFVQYLLREIFCGLEKVNRQHTCRGNGLRSGQHMGGAPLTGRECVFASLKLWAYTTS